MERFSKAALKKWIEDELRRMEKAHGFDRGIGWAQVNGNGEELNRAYGSYAELQRIQDAFDL